MVSQHNSDDTARPATVTDVRAAKLHTTRCHQTKDRSYSNHGVEAYLLLATSPIVLVAADLLDHIRSSADGSCTSYQRNRGRYPNLNSLIHHIVRYDENTYEDVHSKTPKPSQHLEVSAGMRKTGLLLTVQTSHERNKIQAVKQVAKGNRRQDRKGSL